MSESSAETRMRASTENIGIARHREGLELVRIGKPPRGEFAAWRYGDQFGKRLRRMCLGTVAGCGVVWGLQFSLPAMATLGGVATWPLLAWVYIRTMAKVRVGGWGGSRLSVQRAVREIESSGHPSRFLIDLATREHRDWTGSQGYVYNMPKPTRLALEMSLHEEQERRALEGELWILEQAWKEAEEIAAIADNLLLPARTDEFFDRHGKTP